MRYKSLLIKIALVFLLFTNLYSHTLSKNEHSTISLTQKELDYITKNPIIKIAMLNNFKPFSYVENNLHKGLTLDILEEISNVSGLRFEVTLDTWDKTLGKFKAKEVDMVSDISYTKDRAEFTLFAKPYFEISAYLFGLKSDDSYVDLSSLKGKRVAISKDIFYKDILEKLDIEVVEVLGSKEKVDALVLGKIDYFMSSYTSGQSSINNKAITSIKPISQIDEIKKEDLRFGIKKNNKALHSIINKSMDKIEEKEYSRLLNKWMMNLEKRDRPDKRDLFFTQKEKEYLLKKKKITFCSDPSWMPFEEIKDGKHNGIASDYAEIFKEKIGVSFKLIETNSWVQSLEYGKDKKCDILSFLAMETKKRKQNWNFTSPYLSIPLVISTKTEVTFITDFSELENKKIGIPKGYAFYHILKAKYPKIELIEVKNTHEGLSKVKKGEHFGFVGTLAGVGYLFQKEFTGELKIAGRFDESWELAIGVRNDDQILLNILQKTLNSIDEDTHKKIFNKWVAINYESTIDYKFLWQILSVALLILLVFIYWNRKLRILNAELEFQKNKAQETLQVKSNFLANITHEIRTPMNVILGMTYLIQKSNVNQKQKEQLSNIERASKSLLSLINDILDSSKMEAGKLNIVNGKFDLVALLKNIEAIASSNMDEKDIEFTVRYDQNLPTNFVGDSLRLEQILTNLVSNSLKFTQKGTITLSIENIKDDKYRFCVSDTGIGISQENINKIFEPFTQADETITRRYGGTGLGLSISKQLVELLGGTLLISSKLDVGTEISFTIKLQASSKKQKQEKQILEKTNRYFTIFKKHNKEKIDKELEKKLLVELKEAVNRKRPKVLFSIIDQLDKYSLNIISEDDFTNIKSYLKKYMFKEVSEILKNYDR